MYQLIWKKKYHLLYQKLRVDAINYSSSLLQHCNFSQLYESHSAWNSVANYEHDQEIQIRSEQIKRQSTKRFPLKLIEKLEFILSNIGLFSL